MKILYLITGLGGGGAEKVVVDLAERMFQLGHSVKIGYLKGEVVVRPKSEHIELVYLGLESIKNAKHAYDNYKKLLNTFQPDVVHAHMVHANIFARISRKFTPVKKLICTAHSNNEGGKLRMLAYRYTHHLSEVMTNVSQSASLSFEAAGAVPAHSIRTIYNGIDLNKFKKINTARQSIGNALGIEKNQALFVAVGRLNAAKDYPNLISAFHLFLKQCDNSPKPKLLIVGEGEERSAIESQIQQLGLYEDVVLLGRRDDINVLMSAADFFVLSSLFEGFGLVVAEAMACETMVIATDCGGVKEVMGGNGLLVPVHDSQALAEQMNVAYNMPVDARAVHTLKALEHIQGNFDLDQIIHQWLEIYES